MTTPTLIQTSCIADEIRNRYSILAGKNTDRLASAAQIAATPNTISGCSIEGFEVKSLTREKSYHVSLAAHACTCPDHLAHGADGYVCKHRLACYILDKFEEREDTENRRIADLEQQENIYVGQQFRVRRPEYAPRSRYMLDNWTCEIVDLIKAECGEIAYLYAAVTTRDRNGQPVPAWEMASPGPGTVSLRCFRIDEFFHNKNFKIAAAL